MNCEKCGQEIKKSQTLTRVRVGGATVFFHCSCFVQFLRDGSAAELEGMGWKSTTEVGGQPIDDDEAD